LRKWLRKRLLKNITPVPILAIQAQDDELTSLKNVGFLKDKWPVKCFNELILKDSYHMICIDRERAKVTDAIVQFAASIAHPPHTN
jgi:esterase/lipase